MTTLVLLLLMLPLAGAVAAALLGSGRPAAVRWVSLAAAAATLVAAVAVAAGFVNLPPHDGARTFQPEFVPGAAADLPHATTWNLLMLRQGTAIQFYVGVDGLNLWLIVLTALLMVSGVLVSWKSVTERDNEFFAWLLALEVAMIGVFLAFDIILFYVFFELTLVPLFFLIGIWGGPQRQYAARKFFIYTLAGSLITLLGVIGAVLAVANDPAVARMVEEKQYVAADSANELTFSIPRLVELIRGHTDGLDVNVKTAGAAKPDEYTRKNANEALKNAQDRLTYWRWVEFFVFLAMMVGFAIKAPLFPVHTWLPLAHVEAPTAGSVLLAGILLKIGVYGFLRLCIPLAPDASLGFGTPLIGVLGVIGILYGSLCALAQDDIKKLVAYSSVAHLGYCVLGLFALNMTGMSGSLLQMINHGLSTGALFLLVGMLYERYHTRQMADYGGMASRLKLLAVFWVFIAMTSIGLPGLNGFVGETLTMAGMYAFRGPQVPGWLLTGLAACGVVLGAWYMLTLLRRVFFGALKEPAHNGHGPVRDLNGREVLALAPIAALCVFLGVWSQPFLDSVRPDLGVVEHIADGAKARAAGWNGPAVALQPAASPYAVSGEHAP
ncbi:MAG TPA: NADH-quinone oxidoreductase subunit M [Gemmataceae bacterium]|nr:NADH-quinone oxidoreductase subunit M [Gemmataceae bacterium]